ncbi:unnamed protein product [Peronospora belbahrii]|uniref:SHOCT domain-containing protein n=1 Tax=Peronospora belbahrii TaxID=622444 RepID=A0AAU9KR25_9STRA|nr:unnamed protein product [Peronospora belbahrii]
MRNEKKKTLRQAVSDLDVSEQETQDEAIVTCYNGVTRVARRKTREIADNLQDSIISRISTVKVLYDKGFITEDEYERRKGAIVDELTFSTFEPTSSMQDTVTQRRRMSFQRSKDLKAYL